METQKTKAGASQELPNLGEYEGLNFAQVLDAQADRHPDKVFVTDDVQSLTFREFSEATDHLAAALRKKGLVRGEPCGLLYHNSIRYLLLMFAILKAGAVIIPLNTRYRAHELNFMLGFSSARFLFTINAFLKADFVAILDEVRPGLPKLANIYVDGGTPSKGMMDIEEIFRYWAGSDEIAALKAQAVSDSEPASILFTSGTTSQPKAVVGSHHGRVWTGIRNAERMKITDADVLLNPLPFCHEFGGFTIPSHAILCGCKMVIMDVFNAQRAMELIDKHRVSVLYGVPTMFAYMLDLPDFRKYDISSLRTGYMSGATCPLELVKAVQGDMGCNLSVAYGLSEIPCSTISEYDDLPEVKATTIGKPVRGAEARIVDENRGPLPVGTPGEIALRGGNLMIGYYMNPELTSKVVDKDGFIYTSDVGMMDENGYLHFLGRKTDLIIGGGFNIYPLEVEEVLYGLSYVEQAAVVGLPQEGKDDLIVACLVLRDGMTATQEEVIEYCKGRLANYKVPRRVEFMKELPVTLATNKVKKLELVKILKEAQ
ncbi:MAG: Long-chain-fatty-acid--CoA ligase [Syntrophorhabdus sp. PtaB.Bin047]|nr:MAG: Long-chain-fatty-acid--CoA ligase [Syntrophorhabdus sp. PtaB.Bin047]